MEGLGCKILIVMYKLENALGPYKMTLIILNNAFLFWRTYRARSEA